MNALIKTNRKADTRKTRLIGLLRLMIPVVILFYIFRFQVRFQDVFNAIMSCDLSYYLVALTLFSLTKFLMCFRLYRLASKYFRPKYWPLVRDLFVAGMLNTVLPIGSGEIYRIKGLQDQSDGLVKNVALITLDRFFGLLAIITLGLLVISRPAERFGDIQIHRIFIFLLAGVVVFVLIGLVIRRRGGRRGLVEKAGILFTHFHEHPLQSLGLYVYSVVIIFTVILSVFVLGRGLGISIGLVEFLGFYAFVLLAALIPVSVGGLGIRELANITALSGLGVPKDVCVSLGLMHYSLMAATGVVGLVLFFFARSERPSRA